MLKKIVFILCFFAGGGVFASWFGYTNLSFFDGTISQKTLDMNVTVGTGLSGFWVDVYNPTSDSQSLKLDFVSQMETADGRTSCDMISGKAFGDNLIWNMGSFSVAADNTERRRVDFDFPVCTSGTFLACAVQLAPNDIPVGSFDVVAGKVNFMSFQVSPGLSCTPFSVKVFPGSRPGGNFANIGEIRFYDQSYTLIYSGLIESDSLGSSILEDTIPSGIYYVVYKGQSQLASYLSGVEIIQGEEFVLDFTTGANLYNVLDGSYQIAGDLKSSLGLYDFMINGNDIAIVTESGFVDSYILDPKNLNGDSVVSAMDIAVIGNNFELTDLFLFKDNFVW